jgi:hypothetical protein
MYIFRGSPSSSTRCPDISTFDLPSLLLSGIQILHGINPPQDRYILFSRVCQIVNTLSSTTIPSRNQESHHTSQSNAIHSPYPQSH